jgi:hypothetical protein
MTLLRTPPGAYSLTNTYRPKSVSKRKPIEPAKTDTKLDVLRKNGAATKFIEAIRSIATHYEGGVTDVVVKAVLSKWLQPGKEERFRAKMIYELHTIYRYSPVDIGRFLNIHKRTVRLIIKQSQGLWGGRQ